MSHEAWCCTHHPNLPTKISSDHGQRVVTRSVSIETLQCPLTSHLFIMRAMSSLKEPTFRKTDHKL